MKQIFTEEAINNVKVGMNNVAGAGLGYCSDEMAVEMMKVWMQGVNVGYGMGYEAGKAEMKERTYEALEGPDLEEEEEY